MQQTIDLLNRRKADLFFYSPFNFLRSLERENLAEHTLVDPLVEGLKTGQVASREVTIDGEPHFFLTKHLAWDTNHFGFPVFRIELILFGHDSVATLNRAINRFTDLYASRNEYYVMYLPCEDLTSTQALSSTRFRLVETRLNYYLANIQKHNFPRHPARLATTRDSEYLRDVAVKMRNPYDRVHSDPAFSASVADNYLGRFAVECIKGFADSVLVPDVHGRPPFGFLAGNLPKDILGIKVAKLVLAAVDNSVEEGWLSRLLSEMIYLLKDAGADYLTTITQASNRPAIHVWEKAGFKLGFASYVFSCRNI